MLDETSARSGRWRNDLAPFQVEPMDACTDPDVQEVTLQWCAQSGKTAGIFGNAIGYFVHWEPSSLILMQPNVEDAKDWSRDKLEPMIAATPALRRVVAEPRSRDKTSTIMRKDFRGGSIRAIGSNSPRALRGRSAPVIIEDEIDGYVRTKEGNPSELLWRRARTYPNKRRLRSSTPTIRGVSLIEASFLRSDRRFYWVPCPRCGVELRLWFSADETVGEKREGAQALMRWEKDSAGDALPETAHLECQECGGRIDDADKPAMLAAGRWIAEAPFKGHAGFHLNALYLPWVSFTELVGNFLRAKAEADLQSFVNTDLAETWYERGEQRDPSTLFERCAPYPAEIPAGVLLLIAAVDTQDDRLEYEIKGCGLDEESWGIEYGQIFGDPSNLTDSGPWAALDEVMDRERQHELGVRMRVVAYGVDSRGHHTQSVYKYGAARIGRRCYVLAGAPTGEGTPLVRRPSTNNTERVPVYPVGTFTAKETVFRRLAIQKPGAPGYCHFPTGAGYEREVFEQLCAEKIVVRWVNGYKARDFVQTRRRNEALDIRGYIEATAAILNPDLRALERRLAQRVASATEADKGATAADALPDAGTRIERETQKQRRASRSRPRRGGGFVRRY